MNSEDFNKLYESVKEMDKIIRGEKMTSYDPTNVFITIDGEKYQPPTENRTKSTCQSNYGYFKLKNGAVVYFKEVSEEEYMTGTNKNNNR